MGVPGKSATNEQTSLTQQNRIYIEGLALVLLALFLGVVALDAFLGVGEPRGLVAFVFFAVVPGTLLLTALGFGPRVELRWLLYAAGTSFLIIMAVGFILNFSLPVVGVEQPLSPLPLGIAHIGLVLGLVAIIRLISPPGRTITFPDSESRSEHLSLWITPTALALLLLPLLTILSVGWLNRTSDNRPIILLLIVIALLPILIGLGKITQRWIGLAVGSTAISLLYHDSLHVFSRFSGHASIIRSWQTGRWSAESYSLLPNVTLSPTFAHLGGVNIFTQLNVFNPLFVALIPVGSFVIFRRFFEERFAALGAFLVMFIHPFYFQLPPGGRAATPVLFLVLMVAVLTDSKMNPILKQGLAIGFAAAVVTSHYGASYFVMAGLGIALVLLLGIRILDMAVFELSEPITESDGGRFVSRLRSILRINSHGISVVFITLYIAMTLSWFLYTSGSNYYNSFLSRLQRAFISFLGKGFGGGGTANRLSREYGATSIEYSRTLYVIIAILTVIGVGYIFIQRFVDEDWRNIDGFDEFLALSVGLLAVFSLTFVLRSLWGGGRPMAITFSVTALFSVIGVYALVVVASNIQVKLSGGSFVQASDIRVAGALFASLLAVLLILNSGVAAATVLGGNAPSNVPLHPVIEERASESPAEHSTVHFEHDVSMLVWLNTYADDETGVFGDASTRQRNNDKYGPQIEARLEPGEQRSLSWTPSLFAVLDYQGESYVVLPSYSVNLNVAERGSAYTGAREYQDISEVNDRLSGEVKIYSNGDAEVYRTVVN